MISIVFVVLILGILGTWLWQRSTQDTKVQRYHQRPGHTPESPFEIHRLTEINDRVRNTRCHCGGPLRLGAESNVSGYPELRVASCECQLCEEKIRLYFHLTYLN